MTDAEFRALVAQGPCVVMVEREHMLRLLDERERLRTEVAALRLTLGGRTFSTADVGEPIGCPCPGACVQVAEIARLRAALARVELLRNDAQAAREAREAGDA